MSSLFYVVEIRSQKRVCATEAISAGTELCTFTGKMIDYRATLELGSEESFALQIEKDLYLYLDEPSRYFNHSCEPNCGLTPDLKFITLRNIEKNEELRWDYSTTMLEHHWVMHCNCKRPSCRKVVGDFDKLPKGIQEKYIDLNIVQDFIVKEIKSKKGKT